MGDFSFLFTSSVIDCAPHLVEDEAGGRTSSPYSLRLQIRFSGVGADPPPFQIDASKTYPRRSGRCVRRASTSKAIVGVVVYRERTGESQVGAQHRGGLSYAIGGGGVEGPAELAGAGDAGGGVGCYGYEL